MRAVISISNVTRGMFAGRCDELGCWVIIECLDSDTPEIGDTVQHSDFSDLGDETYKNITQGVNFDVIVQNLVPTIKQARAQCFLPE